MSERPTPVVFCGPSGVGKGTLIEMLMKRFPNGQFGFSVSHTTRKPREGEVDGVHYNFSTVDAMKKEIDEGKFVEYAEVSLVIRPDERSSCLQNPLTPMTRIVGRFTATTTVQVSWLLSLCRKKGKFVFLILIFRE